MGSGFSKMKKQARQMQEQLEKMKEEAQKKRVKGSSGGGLVTIDMNGEKEILSFTINPECVDPEDVEGLQDLLQAAYEDASSQIEENSPESALGGGLPGFGF
jgi:nucleoid-associated protein EbfC